MLGLSLLPTHEFSREPLKVIHFFAGEQISQASEEKAAVRSPSGALLGALSAANAWRAALELPVESLTSAAKEL